MKKYIWLWGILSIVLGIGVYFVFFSPREISAYNEEVVRIVWVEDDGLRVPYQFSGKKTVGEFLEEEGLARTDRKDEVFFFLEATLFGGETIVVSREKHVALSVGENSKQEVLTTRFFARDMVADAGVHLGEDDFILPSPDATLEDGAEISVVRVTVREEVEQEAIPFETKVTKDEDLGWREKKTKVKGEKGVREKKYKVVTHNGETVKKTLLGAEITKEPVTEEVVEGTYVKLGKKHTGQGTWYAHTGTLSAASPWLPMGSYAKVTNTENGESVIVKINDRGPFGEGRIIDLDKVAFQKIASLGAGVINVKVEEVLN